MENVSGELVSPLIKHFTHKIRPVQKLANIPQYGHTNLLGNMEFNHSGFMEDLEDIAPLLNLTLPEIGGPSLEEILRHRSTQLSTEVTEDYQELDWKAYQFERFNSIGEDYVEGFGNIGAEEEINELNVNINGDINTDNSAESVRKKESRTNSGIDFRRNSAAGLRDEDLSSPLPNLRHHHHRHKTGRAHFSDCSYFL